MRRFESARRLFQLSIAKPRWRNGRRGGLKIRFLQGSVGSSPSLGSKLAPVETQESNFKNQNDNLKCKNAYVLPCIFGFCILIFYLLPLSHFALLFLLFAFYWDLFVIWIL
jgi:hypothetical protein